MSLININQIAQILCYATTAEIDAINQIIGQNCGLVISNLPPDPAVASANSNTTDPTKPKDPTQPPTGPGH